LRTIKPRNTVLPFQNQGGELRGKASAAHHVQTIARAILSLIAIFVLLVTLSARANAGPNEDILLAAKAGDLGKVEAALAAGASVNAQDADGLTPLMLAAIYGHDNVAGLLLDRTANLNARTPIGASPLTLAAQNGNLDVVKLLLWRGADVNSRDVIGATPLHWTALRGQKNVAALLLTRGALVNAQDLNRSTPLHYAASTGEKDTISLLVAHGADINIRNKESHTPLQEAESSDTLDAPSKASIAVVLRATPKLKAHDAPTVRGGAARMPPSTPTQLGSQSGDTQRGPALPNCWDVAGIARGITHANPGVRNPRVIASAVEQAQIMMGCRQAPPRTDFGSAARQPARRVPPTVTCNTIGSTTTCSSSDLNAPMVTCNTIGATTTCN
jgi:ankyrin repeat protein